jgi:4-hydroxy-tetrahydrodipicolinate synthase
MDYKKHEAKEYAKEHLRGIWAANLTPFDAQLRFDEAAYRANAQHWFEVLKLSGIFIAGKQAEFFSMSLAERKRQIEITVEAAQAAGKKLGKRPGTMASCSDTQLDTVLELGHHAKNVGADYVIIHSPVLHFGADTEETIYEYYRYLCEQLDIGIAMWNHPDCGYVMSPELCNRIADLPNIVAIKYSTERAQYKRLTELAGHKIQVSNPDEHHWLDNIIELGWQLYLCSTPPFMLQTAVDQRMNEYTELAFAGEHAKARAVSESLQPVRDAIKASKPAGKPQAHGKYWQGLIGQRGGDDVGKDVSFVRRPLLNLTEVEKATIRSALASSGLKVN